MIRSFALVLPCSFLVFACGQPEGREGALMNPGDNCLTCHDGRNREAPAYTVAGTVFDTPTSPATSGVSGATVIITDANQVETRLTTNAAGNFYTGKAIAAPFSVAVERGGKRAAMASVPSTGGCATCHANPPANSAPGRIYAAP